MAVTIIFILLLLETGDWRRPRVACWRCGVDAKRKKSVIILLLLLIYYYRARARAGGTCLVAVLHAASVIRCWGRAAGAASVIVIVCW